MADENMQYSFALQETIQSHLLWQSGITYQYRKFFHDLLKTIPFQVHVCDCEIQYVMECFVSEGGQLQWIYSVFNSHQDVTIKAINTDF